MGSTIHPSCTAGGPGGGVGWDLRLCVRTLVARSVLERVSGVLLDWTLLFSGLPQTIRFCLLCVSVCVEILTRLSVYLGRRSEIVALKNSL